MIFLNLRTDLALERHEMTQKDNIDGVIFREYVDEGITVTEIEITSKNGETAIGKPCGKYMTFDVTPFSRGNELFSSPELSVLSRCIRNLICEEGTVLVAGIGNDEITADSLGPKTASLIFSTRHISSDLAKNLGFGRLRSTAAVSTSVLGKTGIESGEMTKAIAEAVNPSAVITVDALAARRIERLGTTVQISTSGIVPGSGVGNNRKRIDKETIGVPVISIGVPMVVDGETFVRDILSQSGADLPGHTAENITVTHKDIDLMTERASRLIAMSINCALQPSLSPEEIFSIVSE